MPLTPERWVCPAALATCFFAFGAGVCFTGFGWASAASVAGPTLPSAVRPWPAWNFFTAVRVDAP